MTTNPGPTTLAPSVLVDAAAAVLTGAGVSATGARTVAESLVEADLRGVTSHGLMLLPMYVDRLRAGSVSTADRAEVVLDLGAVAVLDAGHALGQLTADQAMGLAMSKAATHGVGAVVVRHAFHFGGAYRYAEQAARGGCIGIAAANTRPLMPAPGGATPVVGNNPVAVGVPRGVGDPVVLDMALSEAALGKIRLAGAEGREIPATWATDADGAPTTDPAAAITGMLLPTGGPKGYGLALMVDVLTGVLGGGSSGAQVKGMYADVSIPNDCSHVFIALDIATFGGRESFDDRLEAVLGQITSSALAPGSRGVLLPGQREAELAITRRDAGVPVERSVLDGLHAAAKLVGVELPPSLR